MTFDCNRCDFQCESDDEAAEHALTSGHMRCIVCQRRSLTELEPQACGRCVGRVRADLADIATEAALVPATSLTGLTLLGDGTMQRRARWEELRDGTRDEWMSDPLPVLPALASWEDMIREDYGDDKGPPATLTATVDYLTRNLDTRHNIAQTFHAFDEFAAEVRRHRSAIQHAAGLADVPVRAPATCAECDTQLIRQYRPPTDDRNKGRTRHGTDPEGLSDDWRCPDCGTVVNRAEYGFRMLVTSESVEWAPIDLAAAITKRSVGLLRIWAFRGHVATRRHRNRTEVYVPDIRERLDATRRGDGPCAGNVSA